MQRNERLEKMTAMLQTQKYVSIKDMAQQFDVSDMTIRRDLKYLKESNPIIIMNGISIYEDTVVKIGQEYDLSGEENSKTEDKRVIGEFAASLVCPSEIIYLDMGSTTIHIAQNLPTDIPFTALCNSANILFELMKRPNISIKVAGGSYYPSTGVFSSMQGIEYIERFRTNKMFMSAAGVHPTLGVTCSTDYLVRAKQHAMGISVEKILVVDASKFGIVHSSYCCSLSEIDSIITNKSLSEEWQHVIRDLGIKLYLI